MEQLELNELSSKEIKDVNTTFGGYNLTATAVIENGRITNMKGTVTNTTVMSPTDNICFDAYRNGEELKVNYNNIASDERETLDIISAMVDAAVLRYEA